ncbi:LIM domain-containing protein unc-97 [Thecamonas trahens ATCC 50062]|uniref:LIM domain-containing protein unc-97 n=1 Tax=Thecamonas trahens ATCC 50062 TaxID=461836 RepID=A0A0L0DKS4_THETB|nr:LIM domain-containing protein unc-97 [Thecamonas trahens ATCC 50062]KNC52641.1 LIM domain-containing protein unc-97 [Thecamonas trahens ATCC 50062]|eukprot:XP_013755193.1 LIM domain-containing protein unc-97 [Thecamonas trahens ATCC 50062]
MRKHDDRPSNDDLDDLMAELEIEVEEEVAAEADAAAKAKAEADAAAKAKAEADAAAKAKAEADAAAKAKAEAEAAAKAKAEAEAATKAKSEAEADAAAKANTPSQPHAAHQTRSTPVSRTAAERGEIPLMGRKAKQSSPPQFGGNHAKCPKCSKTVYPIEARKINDIRYHKTCARCAECDKTVGADYVVANNQLYCKVHVPKSSALVASSAPPPSSRTSSRPASVGGFGGGGSKCPTCAKTVYKLEALKIDNVVFHKSCVRCATCAKVLKKETYVKVEGTFYCEGHVPKLKAVDGATGERPSFEAPPPSGAAMSAVGDEVAAAVDRIGDHVATSEALPKCLGCREPIDGARTAALGGSFHPACLKCASCNMPIKGVVKEDLKARKAYCLPHYQASGGAAAKTYTCVACSSTIQAGDRVTLPSNKASYHKACFVCSKCSGPIAGSSADSGSYALVDGAPVCSSCSDQGECHGCSSPIRSAVVMEVVGRKYHPACLKCSECGTRLTEVCIHNGDIYCATHNPSGDNMCAGCGAAIQGTASRAIGKVWHPACLVCHRCQTPLSGKKFFRCADAGGVDQPWCEKHIRAAKRKAAQAGH